jgi:hypothetical protein
VAVHQPVVDRREDQIQCDFDIQVTAKLAITDSLLDDRGGDGAAGPEPAALVEGLEKTVDAFLGMLRGRT